MAIGTVITADIVNSTALSKNIFNKLVKTIESLLAPNKFEFYRGDSFQVYLKENDDALYLILKIRLATKRIEINSAYSADVRMGVGIGNIKGPVRTLRTSGDQAFVLSGRSFDDLNTKERIIINSHDDGANCAFRVIASFMDYILNDITPKQAAILFEILKGSTQTDAAKKLKKSQVTISKQVRSAGLTQIESLLTDYQITLHQFNLK